MSSSEINKKIYDIARNVYEQTLSKDDGIDRLVKNLNMNRGSAQIIVVQIFPKLLTGLRFTRTLSVDLFESFLNFIEVEYGIRGLKNALSALKMHIDYTNGKGDPKIKLRRVYNSYLSNLIVHNTTNDEREQIEISAYLNKTKTRDQLLEELRNMGVIDDEVVTVNHKVYKRDNKTIALIKLLRNSECQICGTSILKRDGTKYVEAAHINPKHKKGKEIPENIILLCPNHHKEFDFGKLEIIEHNTEKIHFLLNDVDHKLVLLIN